MTRTVLGFLLTFASACTSNLSGADDDQLDSGQPATDGSDLDLGDGGGATSDGGGPLADGGGQLPDGASGPAPARIIGYFTAWSVYGRDYHVADVAADKLTHINYAFANISADGKCTLGDPYADIDKFYEGDSWDAGALRGNFNQLLQLKAAHPHLQTLISVGGWTWSGRFSDVALTPASRASFATSCVEFMVEYGFDGIDIDWEYPVGGGLEGNAARPEDKQNYTLLMAELRDQLDQRGAIDGRHYLLTIAAPAGPGIMANLEIAGLAAELDWINLMTYDFHGAWSQVTNFNSALYASSTDPTSDLDVRTKFNIDAAVTGYLAGGAPADKLVVGVPFYGRGWRAVPATNDGLYQSHGGASQGTWEAGVFDYQDLAENYVGSFARHFHPEARVPWLYDPATQVMISYDDPESLAGKAQYVRDHGLGGVMFWELSGDDTQSSLLTALNGD